ncbi:MAG: LamG domain-containing protein [Chloroflexi bacterium]|nr:LamG domain-containing protein [Chloroflexota bacterium]
MNRQDCCVQSKWRWGVVLLGFLILLIILVVLPASTENAVWALSFDGIENYVEIDSTDIVMGGTDWVSNKTISVWIKPSLDPGPDFLPELGQLIVGNDSPHWFGITRAIHDGGDKLWVWNGDGNGTDIVGIEFTPGEWVQITLVHDGVNLSAYKNGMLVGSTPSGPTEVPSGGGGDGIIRIGGPGRDDGNAQLYFAGEIDEVRFWNAVLPQTTIQNWTYQSITNAHPDWADLAAYYKMSDGSGIVLSDDGVHNRDGLLLGNMDDTNWVPSGAMTDPNPPPTPTATPEFSVNLPLVIREE